MKKNIVILGLLVISLFTPKLSLAQESFSDASYKVSFTKKEKVSMFIETRSSVPFLFNFGSSVNSLKLPTDDRFDVKKTIPGERNQEVSYQAFLLDSTFGNVDKSIVLVFKKPGTTEILYQRTITGAEMKALTITTTNNTSTTTTNTSTSMSGGGNTPVNNTGSMSGGGNTPFAEGIEKLEDPLGESTTLEGLILKLFEIVMYIGIPLVAFFLIWSGFMFVSAQGNPEKLETARNRLLYTIIGAIILLGAWTISQAIKGTIEDIKKGGTALKEKYYL